MPALSLSLFLSLSRREAADSMRPDKLKRHSETLRPSRVRKPPDFFKRKLDEYRKQENPLKTAASVSSKAQLASYRVAYRIAKCNGVHYD